MSKKMTLTEAHKMFSSWLLVSNNTAGKLDELKKDSGAKGKQITKSFQKFLAPYDLVRMKELVDDFASWLEKNDADFENCHRLRDLALREMVAIARKWQDKKMWEVIDKITPKNSQFRNRLPPSRR